MMWKPKIHTKSTAEHLKYEKIYRRFAVLYVIWKCELKNGLCQTVVILTRRPVSSSS